MKTTQTKEGSTVTLRVEGRLDSLTAPELEKEICEIMESTDELIIDFEKLEYISSAGLRVLLHANQIMSEKKGMKVVRASEIIQEIFRITGLSDVIHASV